jgi:uncharacterized phage protein (TIGR01671 family)
MREIKFRAWDKLLNEMTLHDSFFELQRWNRTPEELNSFELMQYTGLKDKNDVEIYEGDIVSIDGTGESWEVIFSNGCFDILTASGKNQQRLKIANFIVEIIGNIHQSPELLND